MKDWVDEHRACDATSTCMRIDPPLVPMNTDDLCNSTGVFDEAGRAELQALTDEWNQLGCVDVVDGAEVMSCPYVPGLAGCDGESCVVDSTSPECPDSYDPVCTAHGMNALNECYAEKFLKDLPTTPGLCPDTPGCTSQGGVCHTALNADPRCPDGTTFAPDEPSTSCASGNLQTSCCVPAGVDCTLIMRSVALSTDPFTCGATTVAPYSICLAVDPSACDFTASITQGIGSEPWNADVTVHTMPANQVHVTGVHRDLGRTFDCTGPISHDLEPSVTWQCTACDVGGANCTTCQVQQRTYCEP